MDSSRRRAPKRFPPADNPGKLNAIDLSMWQTLSQYMRELAADPGIRCVVIRGAGNEAFAAGGDLEEFVTARATLAQALHYQPDEGLVVTRPEEEQ